jgi:hypothetical protein
MISIKLHGYIKILLFYYSNRYIKITYTSSSQLEAILCSRRHLVMSRDDFDCALENGRCFHWHLISRHHGHC